TSRSTPTSTPPGWPSRCARLSSCTVGRASRRSSTAWPTHSPRRSRSPTGCGARPAGKLLRAHHLARLAERGRAEVAFAAVRVALARTIELVTLLARQHEEALRAGQVARRRTIRE